MTDSNLYWYFSNEKEQLRYGDARKIKVGVTHSVSGKLELCKNGLHCSKRLIDALAYAPGPILWAVRVSEERVEKGDKICTRSRTYVKRIDATPILRSFAKSCALDVIHLWDCPAVVEGYLRSSDEKLRRAAWESVRESVKESARGAAWEAAWGAARGASWGAAREAARGAARGAAREVTVTKQNTRLTQMVQEGFDKQESQYTSDTEV